MEMRTENCEPFQPRPLRPPVVFKPCVFFRSPGAPPLHRRVSPRGPRADSRLCSCGGSISLPPLHARGCCTGLGRCWCTRVFQVPFKSASPDFQVEASPMRLPRGTRANTYPHGLGAGSTRARVPLSPPLRTPAVRRNGRAALMRAASKDLDVIVRALVGACADMNTKASKSGCALWGVCRRRLRWSPICAIPGRPVPRFTALHCAVLNGNFNAVMGLLVGGADQTITDQEGYALLPTAMRRPHADRHRQTPRQSASRSDKLAAYDAAVAEVRPPASHGRSTACRDRVLRRTPRHPPHDVCDRTARDPPLLEDGTRSCEFMPASPTE
jgi:hypothetical protein